MMEFEAIWKHLELLRMLVEYLASKRGNSKYEDVMKIYNDSKLNTVEAKAILTDIRDYSIHGDYQILFGDLNDEIAIICQDYYDNHSCDDHE